MMAPLDCCAARSPLGSYRMPTPRRLNACCGWAGWALGVGVAGDLAAPYVPTGVQLGISAIGELPNAVDGGILELETNPELIAAVTQFAEGLNPASIGASTWWGVAGLATAVIYSHFFGH